MNAWARPALWRVWVRELRAPFFGASVVPVLVGTAAGFSASGEFRPGLFALALVGMVLLHAGGNVANDYFDHLSGNDPANRNVTPFSGGSRVIQEGLLSPRAVLLGALCFLGAGGAVGIAVAILTRSIFILVLGVVGVLLGYFYTAPPVRLGYRGVGELIVGIAFGVLPVCGSFYLQAGCVEAWVLLPGLLVAGLIFLVLLANEFPDEDADRGAGKRTLVVLLGRRGAAVIYTVVLLSGYLVAALCMVFVPEVRVAATGYCITLPLSVVALRCVWSDLRSAPRQRRFSLVTILLHLAAGLLLGAGFVVST